MQGAEKTGEVRVSQEEMFGMRPRGANAIWREKMHVHIRRQHLFAGPHVQVLAWALLLQKRNAGLCWLICAHILHVASGLCVQRGLG